MSSKPAVAIDGLRLHNLTKVYPGVRALDNVSLAMDGGTVHGIVGENGAGKSTLMKIIAGAVAQDSGSVDVFARKLEPGNPGRASDAGVAMIYQELTIVPGMSALANAFLGQLPAQFGIVRKRLAVAQYRRFAEMVGLDVPPFQLAGTLSTAAQQLIEIMRALIAGRRLVIMDEPTASLGPKDIERLHAVIRNLRDSGHLVVYVSHDLDAVLEVSDAVTVMREGTVVETRPDSEWSTGSLIHAMLGGVFLEAPVRRPQSQSTDAPLLVIDRLRAPGVHLDRLEVRAGEIVGIAGLVGSGRSRLLRVIAGADRIDSGTLHIGGRLRPWPSTPRRALSLGIALAPEDRKLEGLVLHKSSGWNVALGQFSAAAPGRPIREKALRVWAADRGAQVDLPVHRIPVAAGTLSGGNQQKLILARLLSRDADVVLLDEPTRGIDVGAKAQIFATARRIADQGRAIIWSSSDLSEVVEQSDRILVVAGGRVCAELAHGASVHDILELSFAATGQSGKQKEIL
jgi:ABC-type sugar transport system ATPase subunit